MVLFIYRLSCFVYFKKNFFFIVWFYREPHHLGEEPCVPLQPPGAGEAGAGEDSMCRDTGWACGLGLRSERAARETGHWHETGDGPEVGLCKKGGGVTGTDWFLIINAASVYLFLCVVRLQELEDQYRKEREEVNNLLEQQRLVRNTFH